VSSLRSAVYCTSSSLKHYPNQIAIRLEAPRGSKDPVWSCHQGCLSVDILPVEGPVFV
jgi:hypothetical protein